MPSSRPQDNDFRTASPFSFPCSVSLWVFVHSVTISTSPHDMNVRRQCNGQTISAASEYRNEGRYSPLTANYCRSAMFLTKRSRAKPATPVPRIASVHGFFASWTLGQKLFFVRRYSSNSRALTTLVLAYLSACEASFSASPPTYRRKA